MNYTYINHHVPCTAAECYQLRSGTAARHAELVSASRSLTTLFRILLLATALVFSSCSDWFQGKIPMDTETERGSLSAFLTPSSKIVSLPVPEQIFASQGKYAGIIEVSWSEVEGATSYSLQRAAVTADANGDFPVLSTPSDFEDLDWQTVRDPYYSDHFSDSILTNPAPGATEYSCHYYYRVMAQDISTGLESDFSNPFETVENRDNDGNLIETYVSFNKDKEGLGYLFAPCTNMDASKGKSTDTITLSWNGVTGAKSYLIYRDTREDFTSSAQIGSVYGNITKYDITVLSADKGTEFYFKVCAVNSFGNYSALSSQAMGYALQEGAPATPANLVVVDGLGTSTGEINLSWEKMESPEGDNLPDITYSLYRTSSSDSVFTCIKKDLEYDKSSYTDSTVKPGLYYYYYIQAVAYEKFGGQRTGNVLKSAFSETGIESSNPAVGFLVSPPATLEALDSTVNQKTSINLVWTPAIGSTLSALNKRLSDVPFTYNVYYSDTDDGYNLLDGCTGIKGTSYEGGYLCAEVPKKNFYKISTVNSNGTESVQSSAAAPQPDAPSTVEASKTKNLANSYPGSWFPNDNNVYPVLVTWKAPSTEPVPSGYYLYRSTKPASAFRKVTEDLITTTSYLDVNSSAKSGVLYYYKVVSVNSLGQGKKGNDPSTDKNRSSWGYGALTRDQWFREYNKEIASSQAKLTLMHKAKDTDKLGSETINADVPVNGKLGTLSYKAGLDGLGARITMPYTEYADHYIGGDSSIGIAFILNGPTNTSSNMSANGSMDGTVHCYHYADYNGLFQGMYPGSVSYDNLQIKSGAAGGGYYLVTTYELDRSSSSNGTVILTEGKVDWLVGEEIRN